MGDKALGRDYVNLETRIEECPGNAIGAFVVVPVGRLQVSLPMEIFNQTWSGSGGDNLW